MDKKGGIGSLGTELRLTTIPAISKASATTLPDKPIGGDQQPLNDTQFHQ